jgi:hypothetical protein
MLDAPASNIDGFLLREACISSTQLNTPILNQVRDSPLEIPDWQAIFLSKRNSIFSGKQCAR